LAFAIASVSDQLTPNEHWAISEAMTNIKWKMENGKWKAIIRELSSELAQVDATSAGLKYQRLSSSIERSSKVAVSQFSLDGQRQVGGHAAATRFGVDVQGEAFVQLHRNSTP